MIGIAYLMMNDLMLFTFSIYHTSDAILGHISVSIEICRFSWSHMTLTYGIHVETMTYLLSYHDLPGEPLLSHSVRPTLFDIWMPSCFFFWETFIWSVGLIQLWTLMIRITHLVMDDLVPFNFLTYHTSDAILGIFPFWLRFVDLHGFPWSSPTTRYTLT